MTIPKVSWMVLALAGAVAIADAWSREAPLTPDPDFLEFLGSWQTGDDRWIDPFYVEDAGSPDQGRHDNDGRSRDDRGKRSTLPDSRDELKQPGGEPTMPRRDMKP